MRTAHQLAALALTGVVLSWAGATSAADSPPPSSPVAASKALLGALRQAAASGDTAAKAADQAKYAAGVYKVTQGSFEASLAGFARRSKAAEQAKARYEAATKQATPKPPAYVSLDAAYFGYEDALETGRQAEELGANTRAKLDALVAATDQAAQAATAAQQASDLAKRQLQALEAGVSAAEKRRAALTALAGRAKQRGGTPSFEAPAARQRDLDEGIAVDAIAIEARNALGALEKARKKGGGAPARCDPQKLDYTSGRQRFEDRGVLEFKAGKSRPDGRDGPRYELSLRYEELGGAPGEEAVLEMSCSSCGAVAGSSGEIKVFAPTNSCRIRAVGSTGMLENPSVTIAGKAIVIRRWVPEYAGSYRVDTFQLVGEKLKLTKKEPVISDEGNF